MKEELFYQRPDVNPKIYAYELVAVDTHKGYLKVGYTTRTANIRIDEQTKTSGVEYKIVLEESAMRSDGSAFTDKDVHKLLEKRDFLRKKNSEWFQCNVKDVKAAVLALRERKEVDFTRENNFQMRPEQEEAVKKTAAYFQSFKKENPNKTPHFLWNAKMRFGKTFAAYQLAKKMGWTKVLVLTFKPVVQHAWEEDLESHVDFKGWQFIYKDNTNLKQIDATRPFVYFGSFQDLMGKNLAGGIKTKNEWVHLTNWNCVILDEYHYGAWRENAKDLFEAEDKKEADGVLEYYDEDGMPITTEAYLYLSGTPFRAISNGEFIEDQIYNWTYSDEQKAKQEWPGEDNPYAALPKMVMLTYQMPDSIRNIALQGEFNEFDLSEFFKGEGEGNDAKFKYENEVQKWLDLIRGASLETATNDLKLGKEKPPMPFSDVCLLHNLIHTFWFLPTVSSCYAMYNLLKQRQNIFYQDHKIIVAAGSGAGVGTKALPPVFKEMDAPLKTKTITLSCGKLTTGVSIKPWSGIFMLRNCSSPETYFQAAFRVQTPWTIKNPDGKSPNKEETLKEECYIFDFAPNRALRQIDDYSCRLNIDESNPEKKIEEFISFLPVLAYDGSGMKQLNAQDVLDMAKSGTTATLLAKRWQSPSLVNADNNTLQRVMNDPKAMEALMSIEGFRNLNKDIEIIINKSENIKKIKEKANDSDLTSKERKELDAEEKERKNLRKDIQDKLIKFSTRIPVFMYLTDEREKCLKEIITQLEPRLFKKVTGLKVEDFELLVKLELFKRDLMNDAVYKFKRYEDLSLEYSGINRHES
jgi:hypothetical protein